MRKEAAPVKLARAWRPAVARALFYLALVLGLLLMLFPFLWLLLTSVRPAAEVYLIPPRWLPASVHFDRYAEVLSRYRFGVYLRNSLVVAALTTLISTALGALAAYGFARHRSRTKEVLFLLVMVTRMLPGISILVPTYMLYSRLRLLNTHLALVATYVAFSIPFTIWLMRAFFQSIPLELEEAARIDGCTNLGVVGRIALPLAMPGLVTVVILNFFGAWSELMFALVLLSTDSTKTLPVAVAGLIGDQRFPWDLLSSAAVICVLPVLLFALFFERYIVAGITAGAVKG